MILNIFDKTKCSSYYYSLFGPVCFKYFMVFFWTKRGHMLNLTILGEACMVALKAHKPKVP